MNNARQLTIVARPSQSYTEDVQFSNLKLRVPPCPVVKNFPKIHHEETQKTAKNFNHGVTQSKSVTVTLSKKYPSMAELDIRL